MEAFAEAGGAEVRRLYEAGFEGWDIEPATYLTDYVIMVVGILLCFFAYNTLRGNAWGLWGLLSQFAIFSLLEGVAYGFGGVTHHLLDTYYEQGVIMGRRWGHPHSEWMFAWFFAVTLKPLASAACLCTAMAQGEVGVGWLKVTKGAGALIAVFEALLLFSNEVESSGTPAVYWDVLTCCVACCAVFRRGVTAGGVMLTFSGLVMRLVGNGVLVMTPEGCRKAREERYGCPFSEEFNHNAIYHIFIVASIVLIYFGVMDKYKKDQEMAYLAMLRSNRLPGRTCGC